MVPVHCFSSTSHLEHGFDVVVPIDRKTASQTYFGEYHSQRQCCINEDARVRMKESSIYVCALQGCLSVSLTRVKHSALFYGSI